MNKIILFLPLVILLFPMIHADAPSYEITPVFKESWGGEKFNGISVDMGEFDIFCHYYTNFNTPCNIIQIYQNEKIIEQNEKIIELLTRLTVIGNN